MKTHPSGSKVAKPCDVLVAEASLLKGIVFRNVEFGNFTGWRVFFHALLQASWSFPFGKAPQNIVFKALLCTANSTPCQE